MAFDNARLYDERSQVAATLRRSLMPAVLPEISGLELAGYFRPLGRGNEVGGDFYDAFGEESSLWLLVGDVCGKGADAAVLTGFLRHTAVAYTHETDGPAMVLSQVNRAMLGQDFDGRFATAALAHVRPLQSGVEITIASAGHPAALIARADGRVEQFGDRGTLLGVFPDPVIDETSTVLEPGDALALFTDGLFEAHAPEHTLTAEDMALHLQRALPQHAQDAIDALLELVNLDEEVRDDIAILSVRVTDAAVPESLADGDAQVSAGVGMPSVPAEGPAHSSGG